MTSNDSTISRQWSSRPADERYTSLFEMGAHLNHVNDHTRFKVESNRRIEVQPVPGDLRAGIQIVGPAGIPVHPTNWAFGQLCQKVGAPGGYLRGLPAPIVSDCLNYGLRFKREVEELGLLIYKNGGPGELHAVTGPNYGRIPNAEIVDTLISRFGDGVTGEWRVPGEFGKKLNAVTKDNTTLYSSDRDMFVFLADETRRVTIPNRRNGEAGTLARGFYVRNSEVGASRLVLGMFLFDYACCNRILWGVEEKHEIGIRHTKGAPDRWLEQVVPVINQMAHGSADTIEATLRAAQATKIDNVDDWLANRRFTNAEIEGSKLAFAADEGRPMSVEQTASAWDIVTGLTAYARSLDWQDARADLEVRAGKVLDLVAV